MAYKPHKFIRDRLAKIHSKKQFWRIFLIEAGLFVATSIVAIAGAFYMEGKVRQDFFTSFLFITFFILVFASFKSKKFSKFKGIIYKGLLILAVFWGGMAILGLFLQALVSALIMGALIWLWIKDEKIYVHDLLMVLGLAGSASFFGLGFPPSAVVVLLLVFSVYDFIAVYKTKHMVAMAKDMIEKKVVMGFVIPKDLEYFKDGLGKACPVPRHGVKPGVNFMILGGGDVVFPNLLACSLVPFGIGKAVIVAIFSLAGLFLGYYIFNKEKQPIPALPPIALFAIIGYLLTLFF